MAIPGVEQIRSIGRYRVNYLWNVQFPSSPFPDWFPATSVEEPVTALGTYDISGFMSKHAVPQNRFSEARKIGITFLDAEDLRLFNWLTNWINVGILNNGLGVSPLTSCVKTMLISRLAYKNDGFMYQPVQESYTEGSAAPTLKSAYTTLSTSSYRVFPSGPITFSGKSGEEKGVQSFKMDFVVAQVME
jgi:hypothetical protein